MVSKNLTLTLMAVLLATAFAGCAGDPVDAPKVIQTDIKFDFGGQRLSGAQIFEEPVNLKDGDFASKSVMEGKLLKHPGTHTAFDQLLTWDRVGGLTLGVAYFEGLGFLLQRVDGIPADTNSAYWEMRINGAVAQQGMGTLELAANDRITWVLTQIDPVDPVDPVDPEEEDPDEEEPTVVPLQLSINTDNLTTTTNVLVIEGTVNRMSRVGMVVNDHGSISTVSKMVNGSWELPISLAPGQSNVVVSAQDGEEYTQVPVTVTRYASTLVNFNYNGYRIDGGPDTASYTVWIDPDARPSSTFYTPLDYNMSDFFTVHDQLVNLTLSQGVTVDYIYSESAEEYSVCSVDGQGNCADIAVPPYWCFTVSGEVSDADISKTRLEPGQGVSWDWGTCDLLA